MKSTSSNSHDAMLRIEAEHEALRNLISNVHRVLADRAVDVSQLAALLGALRRELVTHFNEEEEGGFFEQIEKQSPRLSKQTGELCTEHEEMLAELKKLCEQAAQGDGSAEWWEAMSEQIHSFSKQLMQHESAENELLQQAYGEDIGAQD